MRNLNSWFSFPFNLDMPTARSLSLQFILQGILDMKNSFSQKGDILDKLCFYSEILIQNSQISGEDLLQSLSEMKKSKNLCLFFHALSPFLKEARFNENVLTLLIENKEKFNAALGERFIETLLQDFFPAGQDQLRTAIHEGYTRRGFTHFLSKIEPLIDAIEWETPCRKKVP